MPPPEWHLKFAQQMVELADRERNKSSWVACHVILRAFEEIIDAYSAEEGLHFHDIYPAEAWQERIRWMRDSKPDLLNEWNELTGLCVQIQAEQSYHVVPQMLDVVRNRLNMMENRYLPNQLPRSNTPTADP